MSNAASKHRRVDWANEAIWVQDTRMYLLHDSEDLGMVVVTAQDGTEQRFDRDTLLETHFLMHKTSVYKPNFRPVQAICVNEDTLIVLEDGTTSHIPSGDAVLRMPNGNVSVMDRHSFNCYYRVVAVGGPTAPAFPFAEQAT